LQLPPRVAAQEWKPGDQDRAAAWELYTELRTRITVQPLHYMQGDEETALQSLADLFKLSREIIRQAGPQARHFATLTTFALNRVVRPVTAKWHKAKCEGALANEDRRHEFRGELIRLQNELRIFTTVLGRLAEGADFCDESESWPKNPAPAGPGNMASPEPAPIDGDIPFNIAFDKFVDSSIAARIQGDEHYELRRRRDPNLPQQPSDGHRDLPGRASPERLKNVAGLAISGGGIRSATFALGAVQRLAKANLLWQFDYLSTVSGGGYLGSFLSTYLNTDSSAVGLAPDKLPFRKPDVGEPGPLRHLRGHSKYLLSGGLVNGMLMVLLAVYGVVSTVLIFWPLLAGALFAVASYQGDTIRATISPAPFSIGAYVQKPMVLYPLLLGIVAPPLTLAPASLVCRKYRWERLLYGWQVFVACGMVAAVLITGWNLMPPLFRGVDTLFHSKWGAWVPNAAAVSGAIAAAQRFWANLNWAPASSKVRRVISMAIMGLAGPAFAALLFLWLGHWLIVERPFFWYGRLDHLNLLALLTFIPLLFGVLFLDINHSSLHPFYRRKLSQAYLIAHADSPNPAGIVRPADGMRLSELRSKNPSAPYHLINCALNAPSSGNPAVRGRGADFFLFSQKYCGSPVLGYRPTIDWEKIDVHLNLGTAMAVSAAAASPFMGVASIPGGNFLLTLFNVRLDYWLQVPGRSYPPAWLWRAGPWYLLRQGSGWMDDKSWFVDVSDGGHIENLAIYELLRRRCKFIVAIDGECDPEIRCGSLMQLIRYALIDFGIDISMDMSRFRRKDDGTVPFHFALATIRYARLNDDSPAALGYLLYVKLSRTGNEPPHVAYYHSKHPEFPHESTADQFFDEEQFEAYRALGEHVAADLFSPELLGDETTPDSLAAWFRSLSAALKDPNNN
jgi:hypothetical protein